jgi:peptidoglycan/xylan/chitin deacetylase (PgdA/CDA1 family)
VFLTTAFIDDARRLFWWDKIHLAAHRTGRTEVRLPWPAHQVLGLRDGKERRTFVRVVKDDLRRIAAPRRDELVDALLLELGRPSLDVPRQMLNWDEVRATRPLTTFGAHTHTHPILSLLPGNELDDEIRICRERIETETGEAPLYFAYPNGRAQDFTPGTHAALARQGIAVAFASEPGVNGPDTDWLAVKRVAGSGAVPDFAWLVSGITSG